MLFLGRSCKLILPTSVRATIPVLFEATAVHTRCCLNETGMLITMVISDKPNVLDLPSLVQLWSISINSRLNSHCKFSKREIISWVTWTLSLLTLYDCLGCPNFNIKIVGILFLQGKLSNCLSRWVMRYRWYHLLPKCISPLYVPSLFKLLISTID